MKNRKYYFKQDNQYQVIEINDVLGVYNLYTTNNEPKAVKLSAHGLTKVLIEHIKNGYKSF